MNGENQELVWLNFHKFPSFDDITTAKETELLIVNQYGPQGLAEVVFVRD